MKPFRLATGVEEEIRAAARWYENRSTGLGEDLVLAVKAAIDAMQEAPESHAPLGGSAKLCFRQAAVRRFPYRVVFLELEDELLVVAVAHKSRRPGYWRSRLPND